MQRAARAYSWDKAYAARGAASCPQLDDRLARIIREDRIFAHNRPLERASRSGGFRRAAEQLAQD